MENLENFTPDKTFPKATTGITQDLGQWTRYKIHVIQSLPVGPIEKLQK